MKNNFFKCPLSMKALFLSLFVGLSSLGFCSGAEHLNSHSFLYDTYPGLRKQAEEFPFIDDDEDELAKIKQEISPDISFEQFIFNECFFQEGLFLTKAKSVREGDELLAMLADDQMARHLKTKTRYLHHKLFLSAKLDNPDLTVLEDIILTALDLRYTIQELRPNPKSSAVVFLGRSPCLYQVALEELSKKKSDAMYLPFIHVNYSGHADALSKRHATLHKGDRGIALNMVTEDKLNFYMAYLSMKKLQCYKQLFIIDILSTGGGIRTWLGMLETLMNNMGLNMPKVHLLVLTPFVRTIAAFHENEKGCYKDETRLFAYSSRSKKIIFDENKSLNIKALEVDATPIHIGNMTQSVIDLHVLQRHCTHGFFFPAQMWTPQGFEIAKKGGDCCPIIYSHLRLLISDVLNIYLAGLEKIAVAQLGL